MARMVSMRRMGRVLAAASLALAASAIPMAPSAAAPDLSGAITMDCAGWTIASVPFDSDPDGDGSATVEVTVFDGSVEPLDATAPCSAM